MTVLAYHMQTTGEGLIYDDHVLLVRTLEPGESWDDSDSHWNCKAFIVDDDYGGRYVAPASWFHELPDGGCICNVCYDERDSLSQQGASP